MSSAVVRTARRKFEAVKPGLPDRARAAIAAACGAEAEVPIERVEARYRGAYAVSGREVGVAPHSAPGGGEIPRRERPAGGR